MSKNQRSASPKSQSSTKKPIEQEIRAARTLLAINETGKTLRYLIVTAGLVSSVYIGYLSISVMAGRSTDFKSVIDWAFNVNITTMISVLASVIMTAAFLKERSARKMAIKQFGPRMTELEKYYDSGRVSSNMKPDGTNPDGDMV